ncbi:MULTISPECIES: hypothetical protein [Deefgea]|uniref:Uncharacterized protein n=1 Tax=Deefgea chitinilytica TaxID=570276 RepID=A0ABS2C8X6_9NEIS|nr:MULTISPECIES: hypothetical protein [Deefgea]MBM5570604.1 hypothetical protein [Deefgea chitinilytica]MBM9887833.1 hypothetical protein [Deefgea sp. CFH1-16]
MSITGNIGRAVQSAAANKSNKSYYEIKQEQAEAKRQAREAREAEDIQRRIKDRRIKSGKWCGVPRAATPYNANWQPLDIQIGNWLQTMPHSERGQRRRVKDLVGILHGLYRPHPRASDVAAALRRMGWSSCRPYQGRGVARGIWWTPPSTLFEFEIQGV